MQKKWNLLIATIGASLVLGACQSLPEGQNSSQVSQSSHVQSETQSSQTSSQSESNSSSQASSFDITGGSEEAADLSLGDLVIVNKKHPLASDYHPGENAQAGEQIRTLIQDMQAAGYAVSNQYSGFRSYEYQSQLYQGYVDQMGQIEADKTSARPGYSEHQTGLAFDILNASGQLLGEYGNADDEAVEWLHANAHLYGFILRYLPGKESITGYSYEPWHLRYVGNVETATAIYQSGLTLEEYYGVTGGDYAE